MTYITSPSSSLAKISNQQLAHQTLPKVVSESPVTTIIIPFFTMIICFILQFFRLKGKFAEVLDKFQRSEADIKSLKQKLEEAEKNLRF